MIAEDSKNCLQAKKIIVILLLVWILLSVLFAVIDLDISKQVVDFNSGIGRFVEHFGAVPGVVMVEFTFFIAAANIRNSDQKVKFFLLLLIAVIATMIPYFSFRTLLLSLSSMKEFFLLNRSFILLFFAAVSIAFIFLFRKVFKKFSVKNRFFANITIKLFVVSYLIYTPLLKYFSGRIRFRDLHGDFSGFTPWYFFNGSNGNFSFPSGHTVLAWMLLPLVLLIPVKKKVLRKVIALLVILWGIFVSYGRILYGAHYASDVLFSTGFTIILFLLFLKNEPGR